MKNFNIKNNVNIQKMTDTRAFYEFKEKNNKNEKLVVEITDCYYDNTSKNSLPNLWFRNGYTNKLYDNALHVDCYCYDEKNNCFSKYNPTIKLSGDKKRNVINFKWLLEVSKKNKEKIIKEIYKKFMGAK